MDIYAFSKNYECSATNLPQCKLESAQLEIDHKNMPSLPHIPPACDQAITTPSHTEFVSLSLRQRCQSYKRLRPFRPVREHRLCQSTSGAPHMSFNQRPKA